MIFTLAILLCIYLYYSLDKDGLVPLYSIQYICISLKNRTIVNGFVFCHEFAQQIKTLFPSLPAHAIRIPSSKQTIVIECNPFIPVSMLFKTPHSSFLE